MFKKERRKLMKKAYFAGGCFWCITPVFYDIPGVRNVIAGYSGGEEENPTYEEVTLQKTGHRETICIEYNEEKVDFSRLLQVFLSNVDPFDEGGQFIDRGASYTLAIFHTDERERAASADALEELYRGSGRKPAVAVEPFRNFYTAEEYHQNFFRTHPREFEREMRESGRSSREK